MVLTFDPFREFDRLAEQLTGFGSRAVAPAMPMDVYRSGDHYVLHCDVPGIDPGSVQVDVDHRVLTIRAERSARTDDVQWLRAERPTGRFERRIGLGDGVDPDRITATCQDGVLTVTIPVAEAARPRRIEISSGNSRVVEGTATDTPALQSS